MQTERLYLRMSNKQNKKSLRHLGKTELLWIIRDQEAEIAKLKEMISADTVKTDNNSEDNCNEQINNQT